MDSVEVYNCSQRNTYMSAIRFENQAANSSSVTNSAVHGGYAWSFSAQKAQDLFIDNNAFIGSYAVGAAIVGSHNVTFTNNIVGHVGKRTWMSAQKVVDKEACLSVCAYDNKEDPSCYDNVVQGNIVAGCPYAGYVVPGHDCDKSSSQQNFRNNVAHSIDGAGANIFPDVTGNSHGKCYEMSHFAAYKVVQASVENMFKTYEMRAVNITSIDAAWGISLQTVGENSGADAKSLTILRNSNLYGETMVQDCPKGHRCWCKDKFGFMSFGGRHKSKDYHIDTTSGLPMHKAKSYGTWAADTLLEGNTFHNFGTNKTDCGARQVIFEINDHESDYVPPQNFFNTKFNNVTDSAVAYLYDPPEKWNNVDDCIGFPCTAPWNTIFLFEGTTYSGLMRPEVTEANFQIIPDTPGVSEVMETCVFKETWNAWSCSNDMIGQLVFIGDDPDWEDRNVAPVWITNEATGYANKLNHQMDHVWDGFYTGQMHKQQYSAVMDARGNYTIEYTSTPFKNMRYQLRSNKGKIKVKVQYWNAGSYEVYANGQLIEPTAWDKEAGTQAELRGSRCGENRFVGVKNFLEFIATPYCLIQVKPVDAIQGNVRMSWTMDEFYSQGGTTSFVDRVSMALGIHASQMKVVAVYKGSVVVEYEVASDETVAEEEGQSSAAQLRSIESKLNKLIKQNDDESAKIFGAPILSAATNTVAIVEDPTYNPIT